MQDDLDVLKGDVSSDHRFAVTVNWNERKVSLWDLAGKRVIGRYAGHYAGFLSGGQFVLTSDSGGLAVVNPSKPDGVFRVPAGAGMHFFPELRELPGKKALAHGPAGVIAFRTSDWTALYELKTAHRDFLVTPDGTRLLLQTDEKEMLLVDAANGRELCRFPAQGKSPRLSNRYVAFTFESGKKDRHGFDEHLYRVVRLENPAEERAQAQREAVAARAK